MPNDPSEKGEHIHSSKDFQVAFKLFNTKNLGIIVSGSVVLYGLHRARPEDIPKIFDSLWGSHIWGALGWVPAVVILLAAIILVRLIMIVDGKEIDRLARERDDLQQRLLKDRGGE